jgi:lysophospholipase L1-like esterase
MNGRLARVWTLFAIVAVQFVGLEAGLRWWGGSEASPAFQQLFMQDPAVGHRLRPGASARYTTPEFSAFISIAPEGVRADGPIGPKPAGETRIVILGDSLVLSVQVDMADWFGTHLERALNAEAPPGRTVRVINAGVQGYGPVDEWLFYKHVVEPLEPDLVLVMVFVGNDAVEAHDKADWIEADGPPQSSATEQAATAMRRIVRASMVLQNVRLRWDMLKASLEGPGTERPLTSYLANPPQDVTEGLAVTRRAVGLIADRAAARGAGAALVLMPARFQTDDADYGRLRDIVAAAGGTLVRDAATERFAQTLSPMGLPILDLLPSLRAEPDRSELFFQRNVHLTTRGHRVVGGALAPFVESLLESSGARRD